MTPMLSSWALSLDASKWLCVPWLWGVLPTWVWGLLSGDWARLLARDPGLTPTVGLTCRVGRSWEKAGRVGSSPAQV